MDGAEKTATVGPLLSTTWSQGDPYNMECPMDGACRTITGCVATAWSQLLKYWEWPDVGTGSHSYSWNGTTLSMTFNTYYDWSNMPNSLSGASTSAQKQAVAKLCYDVGIAADMDYGCSSSGSNLYADERLDTYFKYKSSMVRRNRSSYNAAAWFNLYKAEFDANPPRPVVLSIWTTGGGGHETIADGYTTDVTDKIHINLGWGGSYDGYYDVTQNWTTGGSTWSYSSQIIVTNIEPDGQTVDFTADVTAVYPVSGAQCGQTARLWAKVKNTSSAAAPAEAKVRFWVNGDFIAEEVSVAGLAAGAEEWFFRRLDNTGSVHFGNL